MFLGHKPVVQIVTMDVKLPVLWSPIVNNNRKHPNQQNNDLSFLPRKTITEQLSYKKKEVKEHAVKEKSILEVCQR